MSARTVTLRSRSTDGKPVTVIRDDWENARVALVICDMWNQHWCTGATARVAEMAPRMNQVIAEARHRGVFIIHCPSDTMKYYEGTPQRKLAQAAPKVNSSASVRPKHPLRPTWSYLAVNKGIFH